MTAGCRDGRPALPTARGPASAWLIDALRNDPGHDIGPPRLVSPDVDTALTDEDLQLALYVGYELHYRGFADVDERWEWDARLLAVRADLEAAFETALVREVGVPPAEEVPVSTRLRAIAGARGGPSLSQFMAEQGTIEQFREFAVHRSTYQLKEADPHSWALPRLAGPAKADLTRIQHDEYGAGVAGEIHSTHFAATMRALGLDDCYGAYVDRIPASTLATVNLMSLFGLHRRWLGALVGHLALFEMTSVEPMHRYSDALERLGLDASARRFYDVHVLADEEHRHVGAHMTDAFAVSEPRAAPAVVFGARCLTALEGRFARRLMDSWAAGRSSLRTN
jgi:hypothetical protein